MPLITHAQRRLSELSGTLSPDDLEVGIRQLVLREHSCFVLTLDTFQHGYIAGSAVNEAVSITARTAVR